MLRVGLTGGVGSGKSQVANMLQDMGARVSRSDEVGRALMQPGQAVMQAIAVHFGPSVLNVSGALDRVKLAHVAFTEGRLEELNALVHPAVIAEQARWMDAVAAEDPEAVAVVESALIFETKHGEPGREQDAAPWRTRFDCIVLFTAHPALRLVRYIARVAEAEPDANTEKAATDFDRRAQAQWSDERKAAMADVVLRNDSSMDDLRVKVEGLYATLRQASLDRRSEAM